MKKYYIGTGYVFCFGLLEVISSSILLYFESFLFFLIWIPNPSLDQLIGLNPSGSGTEDPGSNYKYVIKL
jgi:hypothetical protein